MTAISRLCRNSWCWRAGRSTVGIAGFGVLAVSQFEGTARWSGRGVVRAGSLW